MRIALLLAVVVIATACEGPLGPQGPSGEQGRQGRTGETGAAGRDGTDGTDGQDGAAGHNPQVDYVELLFGSWLWQPFDEKVRERIVRFDLRLAHDVVAVEWSRCLDADSDIAPQLCADGGGWWRPLPALLYAENGELAVITYLLTREALSIVVESPSVASTRWAVMELSGWDLRAVVLK